MSRREVAELKRYVTSLPIEADPIQAVLPAVHRLFRAERTGAIGLVPTGEGDQWQVDYLQMEGLGTEAATTVRRILNEAYAESPRAQVAFDARHPEACQRNVFLDTHDLFRIVGTNRVPKVPTRITLAAGARPTEQLRTLLCDRQVLLAEVLFFRHERFSTEERRQLNGLFEAVRKRLMLARQLMPRDLLAASLATVLEAVGGPGFIAGPTGRILFANAAGRARLSEGRADTVALVSDAVRGRVPLGATCAPISAAGVAGHHLVILQDRERQREEQTARAARRWRLTRRQAEVLGLVTRGLANKSIGQLLGCAEHTVELHVSAILERAGAESRSSLAAQVAGF